MNIRQLLMASGFTAFLLASFAPADETRYVQENGITYLDTYRTVLRPITETSCQQTTRTVFKEQVNTETRDITRTWWCPVTTYRAETVFVGRWNPFIDPYYETRWVPETRWVQHNDVVKMPFACRKLVPETQTVQVPVTNQKMVSENVLVSRVAVSGISPSPVLPGEPVPRPNPQVTAASTPAPTPAIRSQLPLPGDQIGGNQRLNQDPPRYGTAPAVSPISR